jgi:hypothetical protein
MQLTAEEYAAMMRELDEAQEWMIDQILRQRHLAQDFAPVISEIAD